MNKIYIYLILINMLFISACSTESTISQDTKKPPQNIIIGLALGGGAAKGFAHIGVIKVLENAGIKPQIITGTSAGSIVGSLYASGMTGYQLQLISISLDESDFADLTLSKDGFIKGERLQNFINKEVKNKPIEQLPITFGAVATDFDTGKEIIFRRGNVGQAVRASSSIPNIFQQTIIVKHRYVDGGLVSPVPVSAARKMGANFIIAVDISEKPRKNRADGFISNLNQSINIMSNVMLNQELDQADIVIHPKVLSMDSTDFKQREQAILEGEKAASLAIPKIRKLIKQRQLKNK